MQVWVGKEGRMIQSVFKIRILIPVAYKYTARNQTMRSAFNEPNEHAQ